MKYPPGRWWWRRSWRLRFWWQPVCQWLKHPGAQWSMDGDFGCTDCRLCGTVVLRALVDDLTQADYEAVLDRWFVDWRHD